MDDKFIVHIYDTQNAWEYKFSENYFVLDLRKILKKNLDFILA